MEATITEDQGKNGYEMTLVIDIFDEKTQLGLEDLAENEGLPEEIFSPLGFKVVDVWRFDDEFGLTLEKPNVRIHFNGDPYDEIWHSNALVASRFGQGGYIACSIRSSDEVTLRKTINQLTERFKGTVIVE